MKKIAEQTPAKKSKDSLTKEHLGKPSRLKVSKITDIPSMEALQSLPEKDRDVCLLHFHRNLSRSAIAKQLNISNGTVHNRLNHGLYLLKKQVTLK